MLLGAIRFVRGRVDFIVQGGYPERFIGQCGREKLPLWRLRRHLDGSLTAQTTLAAAERLKGVAARSGVTVTVQRRSGVPALARRYRLRAGVFAGLALLVVVPLVLGMFLWRVEVQGNETIPTGEVVEMLAQLGVHRGALRQGVDARHVERLLVLADDRISWVGVNLQGSTARIELRERDLPPAAVDREIPHNVVARQGGYIVQMDIYEGQAVVRRGDSVMEGDVLVSGIMENKKQENRTVHARARVLAQVEDSLAVTVPYSRTAYGYRGLAVHKDLVGFGQTWPLTGGAAPPPAPYKLEVTRRPVPVVGRLLSLELVTRRYLLLEAAQETIGPEEAREEAQQLLVQRERRSFEPESILDRQLTGQEMTDEFILFADYLRVADIAEEKEILVG